MKKVKAKRGRPRKEETKKIVSVRVYPEHKKILIHRYGSLSKALERLAKMTILFALVLIASCGSNSSGGGTNGRTVSGINKSGSWQLSHIYCVNNADENDIVSSTASGVDETVIIDGNSFTAVSSDNNCTVTLEGDIVVESDSVSLSNMSQQASPDGCTLNYIYSSINKTYDYVANSGSNLIDIEFGSASTTTSIYLPSDTSLGYANRTCIDRYTKVQESAVVMGEHIVANK